ncbi:MAG TPA: L-threonylcarbamoyladenylate synthase [Candidatus Cybelea sp.]|nr:L-threonylcarbamoyladenylate synthase [Candidatus Cybelea sp.]
MPLLPADPQSVARAAALLRASGVVAFPTETVYGLGAIAFDRSAVARIFEIKQRPYFDPLIVHVLDRAMLDQAAARVPESALRLMDRFWPGALTLVLGKGASIPQLVTAGLGTVAVRMPSHPVARALLEATAAPLAAPSANPFGALSPTRAQHVVEGLGDRVDLVLDGGACELGIESTIVALEPQPALLRPGAIAVEAIEAVIGPLERAPALDPATAPGRLPHHYAPRTPLRLIDPRRVPLAERRRAALLALDGDFSGYAEVRLLSGEGDLRAAAANFFEALHELDTLGVERIDAQPLPEAGLGLAMMDRLVRAAASRNA